MKEFEIWLFLFLLLGIGGMAVSAGLVLDRNYNNYKSAVLCVYLVILLFVGCVAIIQTSKQLDCPEYQPLDQKLYILKQ